MAVRWVDRVPTNPNRMKITPENGSSYFATVERADNPTVAGTPVNAQNLNAMQEASGLTANRSVYVSTAGSDSVGDGSEANPYATINKALASIPRNLNGYTAIVYIAAGSYAENVSVRDFGNGLIRLSGVAGAVVEVNGVTFNRVTYAEIANITFSITGSNLYANASNVRIESPFIANGGTFGVYANHGSCLVFLNTVTINNTTNFAVVSSSLSNVYVTTLAGSNNKMSVSCTLGGVCVLGSDAMTSSGAQYFTDTGGRILAGSQVQIPNY